MSATCARIQPILLSVLRIVAAYLFLLHGTAKFFGSPVAIGSGSSEGSTLVAGILEIVGGILLILGLSTRPVAFILSGQMVVAYFMMHAAKGSALFPLANGGGSAVLFCFVFLYPVAAGGGSLALDDLFGKNKAWCAQRPSENKQNGFGESTSKSVNRLNFN